MNIKEHNDDFPPIMGTWQRMYAFVLILHALIILGFCYLTFFY
jgi:hypothetical protein